MISIVIIICMMIVFVSGVLATCLVIAADEDEE